MRTAAVLTVTLLVGGAPAAAEPVDPSAAAQLVAQACQSARQALLATGGSVSSGSAQVSLGVGRFATSGRVVIETSGTYGAIADEGLLPRERRAALRYLKRPAAAWWLRGGAFTTAEQGWAATYEQARADVVPLDGTCAQGLASAVGVQAGPTGWVFTMPDSTTVTVGVDAEGRLLSLNDLTVDYQSVTIATPRGAVAYGKWRRASEAASLNSTMRTLGRGVAAQVNADAATIAAIDAAIRAAIPADRSVPLRVRQLRRGVLVYGRNPYSGVYHAWRVYLKKDTAVARRVAP
ncbi:MAG: hypothetical protein U0R23_08035 [Candidatus Nanopelagicales bacterium]